MAEPEGALGLSERTMVYWGVARSLAALQFTTFWHKGFGIRVKVLQG